MSVWNDAMIATALNPGNPRSSIAYVPGDRLETFGPIERHQVQPASLDVRLAGSFILHPSGETMELDPNYAFPLRAGQCVLASLVERIQMPPDALARVEGKSSWARHFLTVHSAGFIDPGFHGDITLELKNDGHSDLHLTPGVMIAQISFQWLAAAAKAPYGSEEVGSHYQNQEGATESWF